MGGRGSSSGAGKQADKLIQKASGGVIQSAAPREIETVYREARGYQPSYFKDEVLEASVDKAGNVTFSYARGGEYKKTAKTNRTNYVTFSILAGAVNGETFNVDWSKVNSVSGQTYSVRQAARDAGMIFDREAKKWVRR